MFIEMDLPHQEGRAQRNYFQTLHLTAVATGWVELAGVINKAQMWVFQPLRRIREQLPFPCWVKQGGQLLPLQINLLRLQ